MSFIYCSGRRTGSSSLGAPKWHFEMVICIFLHARDCGAAHVKWAVCWEKSCPLAWILTPYGMICKNHTRQKIIYKKKKKITYRSSQGNHNGSYECRVWGSVEFWNCTEWMGLNGAIKDTQGDRYFTLWFRNCVSSDIFQIFFMQCSFMRLSSPNWVLSECISLKCVILHNWILL